MNWERHALQIAIGFGSLVPIGGGLAGLLGGPAAIDPAAVGSTDLDSHTRYLSGLLLAIGIGYLASVPRIERHRTRILLLGGLVVTGGIGRLISLVVLGFPSSLMTSALIMELLVTPLLTLWQLRIARPAGLL